MSTTAHEQGWARRSGSMRRAMRQLQANEIARTAGANVVIAAVGSVGGVFLARALGPAQRGDLVTVLQWPAVIAALASLGLTQSTCFWVSREGRNGASYVSTAVLASVATGLIVAVLGVWIAP